MKMKYTAIVALIAWLAVTGWLATMVIAKPAVLRLGNQAEETSAMAELRTAIARNNKAQALVAPLRHSAMVGIGTELVALPATSPSGTTSGQPSYGQGGSAPGEHNVTMILTTDGRRSAVIDGQRVRTGSRLPDGSRVRAIGPDWVRIVDGSGALVVKAVRSPFLPQEGGAGATP